MKNSPEVPREYILKISTSHKFLGLFLDFFCDFVRNCFRDFSVDSLKSIEVFISKNSSRSSKRNLIGIYLRNSIRFVLKCPLDFFRDSSSSIKTLFVY